MTNRLLPRLTERDAVARLSYLQEQMSQGRRPAELVDVNPPEAFPNDTGGQKASAEELAAWRTTVRTMVPISEASGATMANQHSLHVGRALSRIIDPIPGDASHDGVWSFLSLYVFPDLVHERWPGTRDGAGQFTLPAERWIGNQTTSRDRNYLKVSWRRYLLLGEIMETAEPPLSEDELVQLTERTAFARNPALVRATALAVVAQQDSPAGRTYFARELIKRILFQTGARSLDLLSDAELTDLIRELSEQALESELARTAQQSSEGTPALQAQQTTAAEGSPDQERRRAGAWIGRALRMKNSR